MPNVSGFVFYNASHIAAPGIAMPGVPVALYNPSSGMGSVAITDPSGAYLFTNVPAGNYEIIESYGMAGVISPVDFTATQSAMPKPPEIEPPLSILTFTPPPLADALDAISPNLIAITVAGTDITNKSFFDGPIGNKALSFSGISFSGSNLITSAANGTIGTFPSGTAAFTTAPTEPYPGVTPGFVYTTNLIPSDGQYSVTNTRATQGPWWGVSDHTSKVETGRYMLINGANPGSIIFTQPVAVAPGTDYVLTAWVLNLIYSAGYAKPMLALQVLNSDGSVLFFQNVNPISPTPVPVWYQNGFKFNSKTNTTVTVQILSQGPAAAGNDYLIDDIAMYRATVETLLSVAKTAAPGVIYNGSTVTFTTVVTNTSTSTVNNVVFKDVLDPTLIFSAGSVTVNGSGVGYGAANPNTGFAIGNLAPGASAIVKFQAVSTAGASPVKNMSSATYDIFSSGTGDVVTKTVDSNPVFLRRPLYNFGQASTDLAESIAYQEAALSHILNAEGEKIQQVLAISGATPADLLAVNTSVQNMVDSINSLECIMKKKLKIVQTQLVGYKTL